MVILKKRPKILSIKLPNNLGEKLTSSLESLVKSTLALFVLRLSSRYSLDNSSPLLSLLLSLSKVFDNFFLLFRRQPPFTSTFCKPALYLVSFSAYDRQHYLSWRKQLHHRRSSPRRSSPRRSSPRRSSHHRWTQPIRRSTYNEESNQPSPDLKRFPHSIRNSWPQLELPAENINVQFIFIETITNLITSTQVCLQSTPLIDLEKRYLSSNSRIRNWSYLINSPHVCLGNYHDVVEQKPGEEKADLASDGMRASNIHFLTRPPPPARCTTIIFLHEERKTFKVFKLIIPLPVLVSKRRHNTSGIKQCLNKDHENSVDVFN